MSTDLVSELELREDEAGKVEGWRAHVLCDLGYTPERALELAANVHIDVHAVERLLAAGATLAQAAILGEVDS